VGVGRSRPHIAEPERAAKHVEAVNDYFKDAGSTPACSTNFAMEKIIDTYIDVMSSKWGIILAFYIFPPLAVWKLIDILF